MNGLEYTCSTEGREFDPRSGHIKEVYNRANKLPRLALGSKRVVHVLAFSLEHVPTWARNPCGITLC